MNHSPTIHNIAIWTLWDSTGQIYGSKWALLFVETVPLLCHWLDRSWQKWAKKSGISSHYSIHSLRHTYATSLYKASGYNLRLVQKQLGHSSPSITQVYADVMNSDVEEALKNLELEEE